MVKQHELVTWRNICGALVLGMLPLWACQTASQPSVTQSAGLQVICAPDMPIVSPGESITVRSWAIGANGTPTSKPRKWAWNVSAGTISGGEVATWSVGSDPKVSDDRKLTATVTVRLDTGSQATCNLEVILAEADLFSENPFPDHRTAGFGHPGFVAYAVSPSARAFLSPGSLEPKGYGLYSYLLFDAPPSGEIERARDLAAIAAYLRMIQPIEEMQQYLPPSQINLALLPVTKGVELPYNLADTNEVSHAAEGVLAVYDYTRAQSLLADLNSKAQRSGPYLVSILPASSGDKQVLVFFDMSRVAPSLIPDWVRIFRSLATKETSWSDITIAKLVLDTRNVLAVAARDTPAVVSALTQWIRVVKPH
jgi:hypothetical protein